MNELGANIRKLGFGLMRLPQKEDGKTIDVEQVKQMVDLFMDAGFTYFDTAWAYAGSEEAIRQALVERYPRDSFQLATKNAAWINCKSREDAVAQFETSLQKTAAGYFDFYLLHNLGANRTKVFEDYDLWRFIQAKKEEGLIRHIGFSFHAGPDELEEILQKHPEAEFVQLQINYLDWDSPSVQARANYEMARKYGKKVVIMEPVKGGMLANPPAPAAEVFHAADPEASCASWAIKFAADLEGIITVLSGMSNLEQMKDNLSYMKDFKGLSVTDRAVLNDARKAIARIPLIPCTGCNYCAKVCPMEIGIYGSFAAMNQYTLFGDLNAAKGQIDWQVKGQNRKTADECILCGSCEEVCPQQIDIRWELERVASAFHFAF